MMTMNKQRHFELPPSLEGSSSMQLQPLKEVNWLEGHGKRQKVMANEGITSDRKWEELDHEILICIMKRFPWHAWGHIDFVICKSWLSAFLDLLFPPGVILDLRPLDDIGHEASALCDKNSAYTRMIRRFYHYLKLNLDRRGPDYYTKVILSKCILHNEAYKDIARRLPLVKSFVSPVRMSSERKCFNPLLHQYNHVGSTMFPFWKNLEQAHCHISMLWPLAVYCKSIRKLTFIGQLTCGIWVPDYVASVIAEGFPLLEHLSISSYIFSFTGLSMILDGHKKLIYLDVRHTICVDDESMKGLYLKSTTMESGWPKDISSKIETFLTCPGRSCAQCSLYFPG